MSARRPVDLATVTDTVDLSRDGVYDILQAVTSSLELWGFDI